MSSLLYCLSCSWVLLKSNFHNFFSFQGSLQVRYQLSKEETHVFTIDVGNFANRRMHHLKINREGRELIIHVNSLFLFNQKTSSYLQSSIKFVLGIATNYICSHPWKIRILCVFCLILFSLLVYFLLFWGHT